MPNKNSFTESIASVFSILPEDQAREAENEVLRRYVDGHQSSINDVTWAEFNLGGQFKRGGRSNIADLSTEVFIKGIENTELDLLTNHAKEVSSLAGLVIPLSAEEKFLWYVPFTPPKKNTFAPIQVRGYVISYDVFHQVLDIFSHKKKLTASEKRVIFQLTSGISLKQAADLDKVSTETKRSQVKAACSKLDCKGQTDLVRLSLGQIVHLVSTSEAEHAHSELIEDFTLKYLAADARLMIQRLPNGRLLRILESGPVDGRPAIVLHGMLFPLMLINASTYLEQEGIRLIIPIRHGYMESRSLQDLYNQSKLIEEMTEDLSLYIQHISKCPMTIIGQSFGSTIAIHFAKQYPDLVSQLILISSYQARRDQSSSEFGSRFLNGLYDVLNRPGIFRFISWQFRKYYADEHVARRIMCRLFNDSTSDVDVLEDEYAEQPAYLWFTESYKHSVLGIAEDFCFAMDSSDSNIKDLNMPITFIHGEDDPLAKLETIEELASSNRNAKLLLQKKGGHLIYSSHKQALWTIVGKEIS